MRELSWGSVVLNILAAPTVYMIFNNFTGIFTLGYVCNPLGIVSPETVYTLIFVTAFLYGIIYDSTPMRVVKALAMGAGSVLATASLYSIVAQSAALQYALWVIDATVSKVWDAAVVSILTFAAWMAAAVLAFFGLGFTLVGGILVGAVGSLLLSAGIIIAMVGISMYDIFVGRVWQQALFHVTNLVAKALHVGMATPFIIWLGVVAQTIMFMPVYALTTAFGIFVVVLIFIMVTNPISAIAGLIGAALAGLLFGGLRDQLASLLVALGHKMSTPVLAISSAGMAAGLLLAVGFGYLVAILEYVVAMLPLAVMAAIVLIVLAPNLKRTAHALVATFSFLILIQFLVSVFGAIAYAMQNDPVKTAQNAVMCTMDALKHGQFNTWYIAACGVCGGPPPPDAGNITRLAYYNCTLSVAYNMTARSQSCVAEMSRELGSLFNATQIRRG